ncbi:MAG: hypothetical protein ABL958_20495 [Bdellovibrionia bacterium]
MKRFAILIIVVCFSSAAFGGSKPFPVYFLEDVRTVGQLRAVVEKSDLKAASRKAHLSPLEGVPDSQELPRIAYSDGGYTVSDRERIVRVTIDPIKGAFVDGKAVVIDTEDFARTYQNIKKALAFKSASRFSLFFETANAQGWEVLAGLAYFGALAASFEVCKRRECPGKDLLLIAGVPYLIYVAFTELFSSGDQAESLNIRCPVNNNGVLEVGFQGADVTRTYNVSFSGMSPANLVETIAKKGAQPDPQRPRYHLDSWRVSESRRFNDGRPMAGVTKVLQTISSECSKNPAKAEAIGRVGADGKIREQNSIPGSR